MHGATDHPDLTIHGEDRSSGEGRSATVTDKRGYRLHSLMELNRELSASLDPYKIVDLILINLMGQVGVSKAVFWMASSESPESMVPMRRFGVSRSTARAIGTLSARCIARLGNENRQPIHTAELVSHLNPVDARLVEESKLVLFAPVLSLGEMRGIAAFGERIGGESYDAVDEQIIQSCLGLLGVALENASLYNRLHEKNRQLRAANEDLEHLDRLRSEFIRNVNHELRTPLTVITAYVDILLRERLEECQRREFLETTMKESEKLVGLLEKLLDFSALDGGTLELDIQTADLSDFLRRYHADRLPGVVESLREFVFHADSAVPDARFDPQRIRQILDAILENAMKFTPQGSRVSLSVACLTENDGEWLKVDIADDGPGIAPERLSELFLPFHQVDGSTRRSVGGMGIGLAFAKDLADKMGGDLRAHSDLGKGAVFSLLLPAA
jgi:signal transduction histidine kinase